MQLRITQINRRGAKDAVRQSRSRNRGIREIRGSGTQSIPYSAYSAYSAVPFVWEVTRRLRSNWSIAVQRQTLLGDQIIPPKGNWSARLSLPLFSALFASRRCICAGPDSTDTPQGAGKRCRPC